LPPGPDAPAVVLFAPPAAPLASTFPVIVAGPYTARITGFAPVSVSVLPLAIVRLLNTRMSTGGPPDCATLATTVGAVPVHEPVVNEWDVEL
jgi:hypothetical protein